MVATAKGGSGRFCASVATIAPLFGNRALCLSLPCLFYPILGSTQCSSDFCQYITFSQELEREKKQNALFTARIHPSPPSLPWLLVHFLSRPHLCCFSPLVFALYRFRCEADGQACHYSFKAKSGPKPARATPAPPTSVAGSQASPAAAAAAAAAASAAAAAAAAAGAGVRSPRTPPSPVRTVINDTVRNGCQRHVFKQHITAVIFCFFVAKKCK